MKIWQIISKKIWMIIYQVGQNRVIVILYFLRSQVIIKTYFLQRLHRRIHQVGTKNRARITIWLMHNNKINKNWSIFQDFQDEVSQIRNNLKSKWKEVIFWARLVNNFQKQSTKIKTPQYNTISSQFIDKMTWTVKKIMHSNLQSSQQNLQDQRVLPNRHQKYNSWTKLKQKIVIKRRNRRRRR